MRYCDLTSNIPAIINYKLQMYTNININGRINNTNLIRYYLLKCTVK